MIAILEWYEHLPDFAKYWPHKDLERKLVALAKKYDEQFQKEPRSAYGKRTKKGSDCTNIPLDILARSFKRLEK